MTRDKMIALYSCSTTYLMVKINCYEPEKYPFSYLENIVHFRNTSSFILSFLWAAKNFR